MAGDSINEFLVESVFPQSNSETTVTGHVAKGTIRNCETVSLTSASGTPLLAPIVRIGSAETPINIVREGQHTTLTLRVEPQHIVLGSRLTTRGDEEAYGATVIVGSGQNEGASREEIANDPELESIESLVNGRQFDEAKDRLVAMCAARPDSCALNHLLARIHLEAEPPLLDPLKALDYVKAAYGACGGADPAVQETLALALGGTGEADHGLRYLERLFETAIQPDERQRYSDRIESFRRRHDVPDLWEFVDQFGAVIFQSTSIEDIVKAIKNGSIPKVVDCRKNKSGQAVEIEDSLAREYPEVAELLKSSVNINKMLDVAIGAGAGLLLGLALDVFLGIPPVIAVTAGAVVGATSVLFLNQRRAKTI